MSSSSRARVSGSPGLADPVGSLGVGEHEDVERLDPVVLRERGQLRRIEWKRLDVYMRCPGEDPPTETVQSPWAAPGVDHNPRIESLVPHTPEMTYAEMTHRPQRFAICAQQASYPLWPARW
jgi:hypothetical protein